MIESIGTGVVANIILLIAQGGLKQLKNPVIQSLDETATHFSKNKGIEFEVKDLKEIISGRNPKKLKELNQGKKIIDVDKFALKFAIFGNLSFPDESKTLSVAHDILQDFNQRFLNKLLAAPNTLGLVTLSLTRPDRNGRSRQQSNEQIKPLYGLLRSAGIEPIPVDP
ncbi:hypothetical protein KKA14_13365 [bacterium]|nr:hypothetical protein [bacterium]